MKRGRSENDPLRGRPVFRGLFCAAKHSILRIHYLSKTPFVRDFPQKLDVEDVKAKLSWNPRKN
jgi:hypothetical protein